MQTWTGWPTTMQNREAVPQGADASPNEFSQVTAERLMPVWPARCNVVATFVAKSHMARRTA